MFRRAIVGLIGLTITFSVVACGTANSGNVTVGSSFIKTSKTLSVSGTIYTAGKPVYVRIRVPGQFGTTKLDFVLEQKDGNGWTQILDAKASVLPNYNVYVEPLDILKSGSYQVDVLANNTVLAQTTFNVK